MDAGAKWRRVDTLTWLDSGSMETNIPVGPYDVEFKTVAGWTAPSLVPVTIRNGETVTVGRDYVQLVGTVVVNPGPDSINAPWTLAGPYSYSRSGKGDATIMNLPIGEYTLKWGVVTGWTKPSSSSVTQVPHNKWHDHVQCDVYPGWYVLHYSKPKRGGSSDLFLVGWKYGFFCPSVYSNSRSSCRMFQSVINKR